MFEELYQQDVLNLLQNINNNLLLILDAQNKANEIALMEAVGGLPETNKS